jgi:hypothetical protein
MAVRDLRSSRVAVEPVETAYRGIGRAVSIRLLDFARSLLDTNGFSSGDE